MLLKVTQGEFTTKVHRWMNEKACDIANVDPSVKAYLIENAVLPDQEDEGWIRVIGHSAAIETSLYGVWRANSLYSQFKKDGEMKKLVYVLHLLEDASSPMHTLVSFGQEVHIQYERHIDENFSKVSSILDKTNLIKGTLTSPYNIGRIASGYSKLKLWGIIWNIRIRNYDAIYSDTAKCILRPMSLLGALLVDAKKYLK